MKPIPTDTEIKSMPKVTPDLAGAYLGTSAQFIRIGLRQRRFPFGTAVKSKEWVYHISGPALVKYKHGEISA